MTLDLVVPVDLVVLRMVKPRGIELAALRKTYNRQIIYILGKEIVKINGKGWRKVWAFTGPMMLKILLWIRERI